MIILIILSIILIISITILILLIILNKRIKKQFLNLDNNFKKRWELLPNIIGIANGYIKYEKDNIKKITTIVNIDYNKLTEYDKIKINKELTEKVNEFLEYSKSYPEMEENENYIKLKKALLNNKNEIDTMTKKYNELVTKYNKKINKNPSKPIAGIFGFKKKITFEEQK